MAFGFPFGHGFNGRESAKRAASDNRDTPLLARRWYSWSLTCRMTRLSCLTSTCFTSALCFASYHPTNNRIACLKRRVLGLGFGKVTYSWIICSRLPSADSDNKQSIAGRKSSTFPFGTLLFTGILVAEPFRQRFGSCGSSRCAKCRNSLPAKELAFLQ